MISKLKKNNGYSLGFALVILVVAATMGFALHTYTMSQTKITKKTQKYTQNSYLIDGAVQESLTSFISSIYVGKDYYGEIYADGNRDIYYTSSYSFDNTGKNSSSEAVDPLRKIVVTGKVEPLNTSTPGRKDFLLQLKGVVTESVDGDTSKSINVKVSVDNIKVDNLGNATYDIYHHIVESKSGK